MGVMCLTFKPPEVGYCQYLKIGRESEEVKDKEAKSLMTKLSRNLKM